LIKQAFSGIGGDGLTNGIANGLNMIISLAGQVAGVIGQMLSGINFSQIGQIFSDIGNAVTTLFANIDFGSIGNMFAMAFGQIMQVVSMLTRSYETEKIAAISSALALKKATIA